MKFAGLVTVAVFAAALSGCGEPSTGGTGGGSGGGDGGASKFCTSTSCKMGETCHPSSKTCVKTCNFGTDCTSEAKTCALAVGATDPGDGGGLYVCSCLSSSLCSGTSGVAGNICSDVDKVCLAKCASNSDCPNNRTCNTTTGQCAAAGPTDGGTDGGTGDAGTPFCTRKGTGDGGTDCGSTQVCNFQTGACETPKTCSTANVQPDTCGYGQFCAAASCSEVVVGSCSNFAPNSNPLKWNPSVNSGPVVYSISKLIYAVDAAFCPGAASNIRVKVHVKAYAQTAVLISETGQPSFNYVLTTGSELALGATQLSGYTVIGGGRAAEFDVNLCAPTGANSLTIGLYYTTGNAACFTVN